VILAELPRGDLRRRLAGPGLRLRLGPVVAEIRSRFRAVETGIALHYAEHDVVGDDEFADFHVSVEGPPGVRRWIKPQALFHFENRPPFRPLAANQAFPLLEWGLNWCVSAHCHQFLLVHAAVVERGGRAIILPAPPGSGKSTLCAALVARGFRLLSDELALIDIDRGTLIPLPRPISLKTESIDLITRFWPDASMSAVVPDTVKGSVVHVRPPRESVKASATSALPGWIVLPCYRSGHPLEMQRLSKAEALMQLADSAFNYSVHGRRGFDALCALVSASDCHRFTYGGDLEGGVRSVCSLARVGT
jgi:HprK-related kinase A